MLLNVQGGLGGDEGIPLHEEARKTHQRPDRDHNFQSQRSEELIEKMASSKTDLKHLNDGDEIVICLDLDAGGGRAVAEFGILNEESETL